MKVAVNRSWRRPAVILIWRYPTVLYSRGVNSRYTSLLRITGHFMNYSRTSSPMLSFRNTYTLRWDTSRRPHPLISGNHFDNSLLPQVWHLVPQLLELFSRLA